MAKTWFKFYGQEYLSDPKMLSLQPLEKALWLTMLCLASASNEEGVIKYIDEDKIMRITGLTHEERVKTEGFLTKFESLSMITNDNGVITILNFAKRQESNLSGYERVKRYREKHSVKKVIKTASKVIIDNANDNTIDNARLDKNRSRIDNKEREETHISYLQKIPKTDLEEFIKLFNCSEKQVIGKGNDLFYYCKAKGKIYKDYKAFLRNALRKDFGDRAVVVKAEPIPELSPEQKKRADEQLAKIRAKFHPEKHAIK